MISQDWWHDRLPVGCLQEQTRMPNNCDDWKAFLLRYRDTAAQLFEREDWEFDDPRWHTFEPASEAEIEATERRLGVTLPRELRTFYQVTNGWPADGWHNPAINRLAELNWLQTHDPFLYELARETEQTSWKDRANDDPDLLAYREEQGTRVMRSLAITFSHNDQPTVLLDPLTNWELGTWAHWNPAMSWTNASFSAYMTDRLACLLEEW